MTDKWLVHWHTMHLEQLESKLQSVSVRHGKSLNSGTFYLLTMCLLSGDLLDGLNEARKCLV